MVCDYIDESWKLNRTNYYQEGWLATGNVRGIVGVTFTTSHCKKNVEFPPRTNYNLRGHRSEVILVKWNEPYQKLASCDSSGIIFVWIKYEGRWSIELINDRNTPVTHFSWSHDGRMALICYQDGFVLVGSVAGQRYWSSMLNLDATITCGIWTPDDQQVYFGTTSGQIIVMDVHGAMVSQVQLSSDVGISLMAWSCEKFKMEEGDDNDSGVTNAGDLCMEWSNSREILAVAGLVKENAGMNVQNPNDYTSMLKFYNEKGTLMYRVVVPFTQTPVSALTWGHNDKRLFLATGTQIHIAWISRRIATLQLLSRLRIHNAIHSEQQLPLLPLPSRVRGLIGNLFSQTIRCCVPEASALRDFVSKPPVGSVRLHCTMIRHDEDNNLTSGTCYTLYLEYLGGLVPLLKGKRISKIRPEFVIFDPQVEDFGIQLRWSPPESKSSGSSTTNGSGPVTDSSESEKDDGCTSSPRMQRRRKRRTKSRLRQHDRHSGPSSGETDGDDLAYVDTLPEHVRLVEVTSNIWGTKFKIHGLVDSVPANLGQVTYKTSLLHLQPRQMTLVMTELRDDFPTGPDPNFNPNLFSEDEEEINHSDERAKLKRASIDNSPPIAPMSPRANRVNRPKSQITPDVVSAPSLAKTESYEDEPLHHASESTRPLSRPTLNINSGFIGRSCGGVGNQRHAISPLYCEGSVPTLQSPKNAVAPSDIIFDRPPAQTALTYPSGDFHQSLKADHSRPNTSHNLNKPTHVKNETKSDKFKFIDEESIDDALPGPSRSITSATYLTDSMIRSCSVGFLDVVDAQLVPSDVVLQMLRKEAPKRLVLVNQRTRQRKHHRRDIKTNKSRLKNCGKSRSLDSSDIFPNYEVKIAEPIPEVTDDKPSSSLPSSNNSGEEQTSLNNNNNKRDKTYSKLNFFVPKSPLIKRKKQEQPASPKPRSRKTTRKEPDKPPQPPPETKNNTPLHTHALSTLENLITRLRDDNRTTPPSSPRLPRSSPASPAPSKKGKRPQSASPIRKHFLASPLLNRKNRKNKAIESSDDEVNASGDDVCTGTNYRDLETFQKAQLRQKLKRGKIEPNGTSCSNPTTTVLQRREFVMHNKAPMWNENSQVYQLDFGGRVTQESAKNFQIEFRGKQVMQFGRIDGNAYTLDFQYPFSALQAFAVALANVTQRLK